MLAELLGAAVSLAQAARTRVDAMIEYRIFIILFFACGLFTHGDSLALGELCECPEDFGWFEPQPPIGAHVRERDTTVRIDDEGPWSWYFVRGIAVRFREIDTEALLHGVA